MGKRLSNSKFWLSRCSQKVTPTVLNISFFDEIEKKNQLLNTGWPVYNRTAILSNLAPKYQFFSKMAIISIFAYVSRFLELSLKFSYLNPNRSYIWKTTSWKKAKSPHLVFGLPSTSYSQFSIYFNKILWKVSYGYILYYKKVLKEYSKRQKSSVQFSEVFSELEAYLIKILC